METNNNYTLFFINVFIGKLYKWNTLSINYLNRNESIFNKENNIENLQNILDNFADNFIKEKTIILPDFVDNFNTIENVNLLVFLYGVVILKFDNQKTNFIFKV